MIICVSIVDKHKPSGQRHVGTYQFEVDYPGDSHFDFMTLACPVEHESEMRPFLNKLIGKDQIPDAIRGDGSPL